MRLAHLSDLHLARRPPLRLFTPKRLLAWLNWLGRRQRAHPPELARTRVRLLAERRPELVLLTGDVGQLGWAGEYAAAWELLAPLRELQIPILLLGGNHDHYGQEAESRAAWAELRRDLAAGRALTPPGLIRWPELAVVVLEQGRPLPLFAAYGQADLEQLAALTAAGAGSAGTPLVAAGHFPLQLPEGQTLPPGRRLRGEEQTLEFLRRTRAQAYFCGHLHQAYVRELFPGCRQYCAGSLTAEAGAAYLLDCAGGRVELIETIH